MRKILIAVVVLVIVGVGAFLVVSARFNQQMAAISVRDVDLSKVADGTYTGKYDATIVSAQVQVTVQNHVITDIQLVKHSNGKGQAAEVLPGQVLSAQSVRVDTISGATHSSRVILKAISLALQSGLK